MITNIKGTSAGHNKEVKAAEFTYPVERNTKLHIVDVLLKLAKLAFDTL